MLVQRRRALDARGRSRLVVPTSPCGSLFFVNRTATRNDVRETVRAVERFAREAVKWG